MSAPGVVRLAELLRGEPVAIEGDGNVAVLDVAYDSRAVTPGALFFAVSGEHYDGHDFLDHAAAAGAVAAVVARDVPLNGFRALARVEDVRRTMGPVAHRFFGDPTAGITLAGVTGTNGKTTTTHVIYYVFSSLGPAGLVGTVEHRVAERALEASRTTPEAVDLARLFAQMRDADVTGAAMEVSSHALDQGRHRGCRFDAVAFTNLSQDHLDYHGTMERYFLAKRALFEDPSQGAVRVVNADDEFGARLIADGLADVTYGAAGSPTLKATALQAGVSGTTIELDGMGLGKTRLQIPLVGVHNVANVACAAAVCLALGVDPDAVLERLVHIPQVPGRLQRVDAGQPFAVFVDYAHTPDGLAKVIPAVREITQGRVLTVFGCGGDRDRAKRPLMGETAARLSDEVFVTSDNPRSEDPEAIIEDIMVGVRGAAALAQAAAGDSVLIAGKGHETGQEIGGRVIPFDDRCVVEELLAEGLP